MHVLAKMTFSEFLHHYRAYLLDAAETKLPQFRSQLFITDIGHMRIALYSLQYQYLILNNNTCTVCPLSIAPFSMKTWVQLSYNGICNIEDWKQYKIQDTTFAFSFFVSLKLFSLLISGIINISTMADINEKDDALSGCLGMYS